MICKKCGAELPAGATDCPQCGYHVGKKKLSRGATIAITAVLVLLVAGLFAALLLMNRGRNNEQPQEEPGASATGQTQTEQKTDPPAVNPEIHVDPGAVTDYQPAEGSYTWPAAQVTRQQLDAVVATAGSDTLTNEQLTYYYWYGIRTFLNTYSEYLGNFMDPNAPLDGQYYDNEKQITWQSYFLDQALSTFQYYAALNQAAARDGFTLPESLETYLAGLGDSMAKSVTEYGYPDVDTYLKSCFGSCATLEGYVEFTRAYLAGSTYASSLQSSLSFTEEEIEAYFTEHEDMFAESGITKDGTRLVSMRHVLIMPEDTESDADWKEAELKANSIYTTWKKNGNEESFAQLANNYSQDGGSNTTGGLYNNIYPGQLLSALDEWCFDDSREIGDNAVVKTEAGYHIVYFVGYGDEYWRFVAYNSLLTETYSAMEADMIAQCELKTDYDQIILLDPVGMYN